MNKKSIRKALKGGSYLSPSLARGRMLRAPEGEGEMGSPAGDSGNGGQGDGGNAGGSASGESGNNNTGTQFDPSSFWGGQSEGGDSSPSGESAGKSSPPAGNGEGDDLRTQLTNQLTTMKFGDPIFDANIAEEINQGNFEGVQTRMEAMGRSIVQQAMAMQVQILRPLADQIMEQARSEFKQTFDSRDNTESLERLFPAAKNPVMAKTIQPIYDQALKNAKGNREAAVKQTKEMLKFMAGESAQDLNLDVAPRGQGDRGGPTPSINWLDELTSR